VEPQERARRLSGGVTHGERVLRPLKAESTIESVFRRLGKDTFLPTDMPLLIQRTNPFHIFRF
jgi:hypothetical protein